MTQNKEKKQLLLLISVWVSFILAVTEPEQSILSIFTPFLAQNTTKAFELIYLHGPLNMYEREAVKLQSLRRSSSSLWIWIIHFHLYANIRQRISEQSFHVLFLGFSMSHLNNYFTDTEYDDVNIYLLGWLSCNVFMLFRHRITICSDLRLFLSFSANSCFFFSVGNDPQCSRKCSASYLPEVWAVQRPL